MTREAVTVAALPHRAPWRRVQRALRLAALAFLLWSTAGAPAPVHAQWLGLPDPPDPPDEVDCVACTGEAEEAAPTSPTPAPTPTTAPPRAPLRRHELTLGAAFSITAIIARPRTVEGADYRIVLSRREAMAQLAWTVFGRRMVGLRVGLGVAVGKPVLTFQRPVFFDLFGQEPIRLPGAGLSLEASVGLVVRVGPVRLAPQLVFHNAWLRDAGEYTVDVDVPYTTPAHVRAPGFGLRVEVHPHPSVVLSLETNAYVHQGQPGASLRFGLGACWPGGARAEAQP
jgi:hypothetical protein